MSKSRFVFKQITVRGNSNCDLTRYVAKSKLDQEREGQKPRPLFTERDDNLNFNHARKWLSITGGTLEKRDCLHYVLSFENAREYELLGDGEDERRTQVISSLRRLLPMAFSSAGIAEMRWVAGVHRNTDNPHIHLLLNKNIIEKKTGDIARIAKLTAPLISHYEIEKDRTRTFNYGVIINDFAREMDARHRAYARFLQFENRAREVNFTRTLLSPKTLQTREPSKDEILVGRWIVNEIENAQRARSALGNFSSVEENSTDAKSSLNEEYIKQLREEVSKLDFKEIANGSGLTEAFIETETLRSILINPQLNVKIFSSLEEISITKSYSLDKREFTHVETLSRQEEITRHKPESKDKSLIITTQYSGR